MKEKRKWKSYIYSDSLCKQNSQRESVEKSNEQINECINRKKKEGKKRDTNTQELYIHYDLLEIGFIKCLKYEEK